jgi:hypothetical protein
MKQAAESELNQHHLRSSLRRSPIQTAIQTAHGCCCWTMSSHRRPEPPLLGHMRKRLNELINANLRFTFGQ